MSLTSCYRHYKTEFGVLFAGCVSSWSSSTVKSEKSGDVEWAGRERAERGREVFKGVGLSRR